MRTSKYFFLLLCYFIPIAIMAQEVDYLTQIIPPSPTAASLGKYADIPVSNYTGIPNINIPIWTMEGQGVSLPISLSYHSGGIKVEENASWVGLGWSLNAGGVVSRTVRGLADESSFGYYTQGGIPSTIDWNNFFDLVINNQRDPEPDIFFFNFNGFSGKFVIANDGVAYSIPHQDLKIEFHENQGFETFTITTPDGIQYVFGENGQFEETFAADTIYDIPTSIGFEHQKHEINTNISSFRSSWYLTSIISPSGDGEINFEYEDESYEYESAMKGKIGMRSNGEVEYKRANVNLTRIHGKRLKSITSNTNQMSIAFIADKDREDLRERSGFQKPKSLTEIQIKDINGAIYKRFKLNNHYFEHSDLTSSNPPIAEKEYQYKRLKLLDVQEFSGDGSEFLPAHTFTYNENVELPPKDAQRMDHWGYYNGSPNNTHYDFHYGIPAYKGGIDNSQERFQGKVFNYATNQCEDVDVSLGISPYVEIPGVSREPSETYMKAGILKEIQYPTGGKTILNYEAHKYGYIGDQDFEEIVFPMKKPGAQVERPSDEFDPMANKMLTYSESFTVPNLVDPNQYQLTYHLEYSYHKEDVFVVDGNSVTPGQVSNLTQGQIDDGFSFTRNEVVLTKAGQSDPILKIYYDSQRIILQKGNTYTDIYPKIEDAEPHFNPLDSPDGITAAVSGTSIVTLDPGDYEITAIRSEGYSGEQNHTEAYLVFNNEVPDGNSFTLKKNFLAGGLRLAQKTDIPLTGENIVTNYSYEMHDGEGNETGKSSGNLVGKPEHFTSKYFSDYELATAGTNISNSCPYNLQEFTYLVFTADAGYVQPLSSTQGAHLGYREVAISQSGNGKTIFKYQSPFDRPDTYPKTIKSIDSKGNTLVYISSNLLPKYIFPHLPVQSEDWKRGLLKEILIYSEEGKLLSKEETVYRFITKKEINGISIIFSDVKPVLVSIGLNGPIYWADYVEYYLKSGWLFKEKVISTQFDQEGEHPITTVTDNKHDGLDHIQLTRTSTRNSDGVLHASEFFYPTDFTGVTTGPIATMKEKNMLAVPVEVTKEVDFEVISGTFSSFSESSGKIRPSKIFTMNTTDPITYNPNLNSDARGPIYEARAESEAFDQYGNLLGQKKTHSPSTQVYLWGYNNSLPVAQVIGKDLSHSQVVALLNGVNIQGLTGTSLEVELNKIRTALPDAFVTTYTYTNARQIHKVTDPNGKYTEYKYDNFGRLFEILDHNGYVINHREYKYHNQ